MKPHRRGFLATLFAPVVARFMPKPKPSTGWLSKNAFTVPAPGYYSLGWADSPGKLKIGDTIVIRRPTRLVVKKELLCFEGDESEYFTITDDEMLRRIDSTRCQNVRDSASRIQPQVPHASTDEDRLSL